MRHIRSFIFVLSIAVLFAHSGNADHCPAHQAHDPVTHQCVKEKTLLPSAMVSLYNSFKKIGNQFWRNRHLNHGSVKYDSHHKDEDDKYSFDENYGDGRSKSISCPPNQHLVDGRCKECKNGQSYQQGQCRCRESEYWTGTTCILCTDGQIVHNETCVCPYGFHWSGNGCVGVNQCPVDYNWDGARCIKCFGGQTFRDGFCQCKPDCELWDGQTCHPCTGGRTIINDECVCPIGQHWNDGNCGTNPPCEPGYRWDGRSQCVQCHGGQFLINHECSCRACEFWNGTSCVHCTGGQVKVGNMCQCPDLLLWDGMNCRTTLYLHTTTTTSNREICSTLSLGPGSTSIPVTLDGPASAHPWNTESANTPNVARRGYIVKPVQRFIPTATRRPAPSTTPIPTPRPTPLLTPQPTPSPSFSSALVSTLQPIPDPAPQPTSSSSFSSAFVSTLQPVPDLAPQPTPPPSCSSALVSTLQPIPAPTPQPTPPPSCSSALVSAPRISLSSGVPSLSSSQCPYPNPPPASTSNASLDQSRTTKTRTTRVCPSLANYPKYCPNGSHFTGRSCIECGPDRVFVGDRCRCKSSMYWGSDAKCVACPAIPLLDGPCHCIAGYAWNGEHCEIAHAPCQAPAYFNGVECITCMGGQYFHHNECRCPPCEYWNGCSCERSHHTTCATSEAVRTASQVVPIPTYSPTPTPTAGIFLSTAIAIESHLSTKIAIPIYSNNPRAESVGSSSSNSNLGLILGLSIASGAITIAGSAYAVWRYNQAAASSGMPLQDADFHSEDGVSALPSASA